MAYQKRKNNRIQDLSQIKYIKNILEASAKQCQDEGMYSPEVYLATAQRMADAYSAQNSQYPRITFNSKEQKLRGQQNSVTELTATIGERTSTSYFLVKDSLSERTLASQEELTYLRPDIVSNRIAANLGIAQTLTIPPIGQTTPGQGIPSPTPINFTQAATTPTMPSNMSKAEMMATQANTQQQIDVPPIPPQATQPNPLLDGFAALAKDAVPPQPIPPQAPVAPPVNKNPYAAAPIPPTQVVSPQPIPLQPIHNPQLSEKIKQTNQDLQTVGNLNQNIGKALKDMAKGQINPIQLYGDTLNIIGSFINGIPAGIQEARLKNIAQQMKLVEEKKRAINLKMDRVGNDFIASENKPPESELQTTAAPDPNNFTPLATSHTKPQTESQQKPEDTAIDKLLKSNASLDDKLDAIEKTLDKMLEELIKIEKNLEAIKSSLESNTPAPMPDPKDMVLETEAKTEVELVANDPMAEVSTRTEIDTHITAEAKTQTSAAKEVEVPSVIVDSIPDESELDLDRELANVISSYEGDLDRLNQHLQNDQLCISLAEDGSYLSIAEVDHGILDPIFNAEANGAGWNIQSGISDSKKLEVLESFVEAEAAALAEPEPKTKQVKESQVPVQEELCIT